MPRVCIYRVLHSGGAFYRIMPKRSTGVGSCEVPRRPSNQSVW